MQRATGKVVVSEGKLTDGGTFVRQDAYKPKDGALSLRTTTIKGTHANGVTFTNAHGYVDEADRATVAETTRQLADVRGVGEAGASVMGAIKSGAGFVKTVASRSDASIQTTRFPDGRPSQVVHKLKLADGTVQVDKGMNSTAITRREKQAQ